MSVNPFAGGGGRQPDEIDLGDGRVIVLRQPEAGPRQPGPAQPGVPPPGTRFRPRPSLPGPRLAWVVFLFFATVVSTFMVQTSVTPEGEIRWQDGLLYAGGIMTILVCHELGHFFQARRYHVPASLPIFLPMPLSPIGTLGALILMRPRVARTREMFDIAISGPLAGLVPTFLCLLIGLPQSTVVPTVHDPGVPELGEPLAVQWLVRAFFDVPEGHTLLIGPLAFAGWVGLLITALNLLPVAQLDGGHIMYTLARQRAFQISAVLLLAAALGMIVTGYWAWTLMIVLLLIFGIRHPPLADDPVPDDLGLPRRILGWVTLIVSAVLFLTPMPFQMPDL